MRIAARPRTTVAVVAAAALLLAGVGGAYLSLRTVGGAPEPGSSEALVEPQPSAPPAQVDAAVRDLPVETPVPVPVAVIVPPAAQVPVPAAPLRRSPAPVRLSAPPPALKTRVPVIPPLGPPNPSSYRFTSVDVLGRPARWDPCQSIRWGFNPDKAPPAALELAQAAIGRLAAASGLAFSYAGTTGYRPLKQPEGAMPAGFDAVIAFGTVDEYADFTGGTFGIGGFTSTIGAEGSRIVRGGVVLNAPAVAGIPDGFGRGQRRGGALLHELGHMVGLDHVSDPSQMMNPALTTGAPADYAEGDRTGLSKVGAQAGCYIVPAPPRFLPPIEIPPTPTLPGDLATPPTVPLVPIA